MILYKCELVGLSLTILNYLTVWFPYLSMQFQICGEEPQQLIWVRVWSEPAYSFTQHLVYNLVAISRTINKLSHHIDVSIRKYHLD